MSNNIKFPPNRYIRDDTDLCTCGSSKRSRFFFWSSKNCCQPNCIHYYKGFPSEDYNPKAYWYDFGGKIQTDISKAFYPN